jgi:DNA-binding response OmpR family regulator
MKTEIKKPVLLAIDDDGFIGESLSDFFVESGFTVLQACNGYEGVNALYASRPDIVITDLLMPNGGGFEVLDAVRKFDDSLPVIALSGTEDLEDAVRAFKHGAWDYLSKPVINPAELEHAVTSCLERARMVREDRIHKANLEFQIKERTTELRKMKKSRCY